MALVNYPGVGCIVEYMEGNALHIAVVTEEQSGKLRLLLPNRRETRLGANRLLPWSGPTLTDMSSRENIIRALEEHKERRQNLARDIDVLDVWNMAQGEVENATAQWFAELCATAPNADTVAAYGQALLQCKTHFKLQTPNFEIYTEETVTARLAEQEAANQRESLITRGGTFFRILWDVWNKKRSLPSPDSDEWPTQDVALYLEKILRQHISDPESTVDDTTWRMLIKGLPDIQHLPLHLATAWGLVLPHHNIWLDRADYSPGDAWTEKHKAAIDDLIALVEKTDAPTVSLPFISIDSESTRDIDDAYYIEMLDNDCMRLHLALACPALLWPFGSALDKAVFRRATSIYLPEDTHHMMPEILSTNTFSLLAQQIRPALHVICDVDTQGQISHFSCQAQWVCIAANLCYTDCETILQSLAPTATDSADTVSCNTITSAQTSCTAHTVDTKPSAATPYTEQLHLGERFAHIRQKARIADGAVIMDRPDVKLHLEGEGENTQVLFDTAPQTPRSQLLVSEMMILASTALAHWGHEQGLPLLYRTQDVAIPREYAGVWTEPHHMARIIRALIPSTLETAPRQHAGLGVRAYAPITSPLRRYTDLVNEAQVLHFLLHTTPQWDKENLDAMLLPLKSHLDAAGQAQRFRPRYWLLHYIRQQGDKVWWDAVVTEENDHFVVVNLPREQLIVRGRRHLFGERACPGQPVQVRLGKINPLYNEITLLEVTEM